MSAVSHSCVLRLARGPRRAEIRFKDGKVVSATVHALQNLPALHHVLLWEEAKVSVAGGAVAKPSQFPLSAQEVLDECERFLRDFAHAARDLGPPNTIYQPVPEPRPAICRPAAQPDDAAAEAVRRQARPVRRRRGEPVPHLRHDPDDPASGRRRRADDAHRAAADRAEQRISRPVAPLNGRGTGPQSMLGQWAMVPDQRGVVGDRRSPSRPLLPFGAQSLDQPGRGNDWRKPSQPFKPFATPGPTPLPTPRPTMVTPHRRRFR